MLMCVCDCRIAARQIGPKYVSRDHCIRLGLKCQGDDYMYARPKDHDSDICLETHIYAKVATPGSMSSQQTTSVERSYTNASVPIKMLDEHPPSSDASGA
ncbi:hypothetical protein BKA67DRAFT_543939 [Truncatella angustata]|uniref:Uncharacterized protein n=1 Tax=Truncatella angustata TaxID=152316 RepID=A0A9P8UW35_9PEZI|nr:uncharacterized protein BKA67DRAFT_543939 [Truncatella angustata]KAH6659243.1 hypothetical protein BKA67DRAFT_543939 [Truncatella angustata]